MQGKAYSIYEKLYSKFGPQKWWPTTLDGDTEPTYNGLPPDNKGRFEIAVGAILTQNTAWTNVVKAIANLNKLALLSPGKILSSDKELLTNAIRSSGYFNQKYKKLIALSHWWSENFDRIEIASNDKEYIDGIRKSLLSVKGVGSETADSILLYAFDMPTFVIDAYTKRILARHYGINPDIKYEDLRSIFMAELPASAELFKEYHALIVELGKNHCHKSVCLPSCPLRQ
jgi:endonuclease-3 related protein